MSRAVSLSIKREEVQLRFLGPDDIPEVRRLCLEWFPIDYPDCWYELITSNPKFYSLAATYNSMIIGIIVCEVKTRNRCNREDQDLLASYFPISTQLAYILSLGVDSCFRRNGIGSLLLESLISYLTNSEHNHNCKAIYLHVLHTNITALHFYEKHNFRQHAFLPYYYSINGSPQDGYSYVLYINGGQPPWSIVDYVKHFGNILVKLQPCALPQRVLQTATGWWRRISRRPSERDKQQLSNSS